jgi:hypothetical protein
MKQKPAPERAPAFLLARSAVGLAQPDQVEHLDQVYACDDQPIPNCTFQDLLTTATGCSDNLANQLP